MASAPLYNPLLGPPPPVTPEDYAIKKIESRPPPEPKRAQDILSELPNPGQYEQLHMEVKSMLAQSYAIDGARVMVGKPISENFQVQHNISMGPKDNRYNFGVTYVGGPQFGSSEFASPLLIGDIDASGNLTARVIHWVRPNVLAKLTYQGQVGSRDQDVAMAEFDFRGADYTAAVKVQNPDIVNEGGTWIAQYMQSITKKLALGGELIYQYQMGLQQCDLNFAGRYKSDKGVATATLSPLAAAFALSYAHKVNEKITLGTEVTGNLLSKEAQCAVGYQFDLRQNAVRGQVNNRGVIIGILENKLAPGLSFTITGQLNHFTGLSVFGIGFTLGV